MERPFDLQIEERDGVTVAHIEGEVDIANIADVRRELTSYVSNSALGLVVDLSEVRYLDSSGLNLLYEMSAALKTRRQSLRVVAPEGSASRRVFDLTAFDKVVPMSATVGEALKGIAGEPRVAARPHGSRG